MTPLTSYHMRDEDDFDEVMIEAVQPIPDPHIRFIACSERDAEILRVSAELWGFVGRAEEAMALQGLAHAYILGAEA